MQCMHLCSRGFILLTSVPPYPPVLLPLPLPPPPPPLSPPGGSRIRSPLQYARNMIVSSAMKCTGGDSSGLNQAFYVSDCLDNSLPITIESEIDSTNHPLSTLKAP